MTFRTPDEAVALANNTPLRPRRLRLDARTSTARSMSRRASRRAWSGSIRPTCSTPPRASAAIAKAALAAKAGAKACPSIASHDRAEGQAATRPRPPRAQRLARRAAGADAGDASDRTAEALYRRQAGAARFRLQLRRARSRRAAWSDWPGSATARTSATRSKPRARRPAGARRPAHNRAQVLYYVAENLAARADEFAAPPQRDDRRRRPRRARRRSTPRSSARSVYAGFADKFDGAVHATRSRFVTLAMNEPWGVMGIVCPNEAPLLAFVSLVDAGDRDGQQRRRRSLGRASAERHRLLFSVLDTSDVPAGVVNIVTGEANVLAKTLAEHDGVDALWYVGDAQGALRSKRFPPAISRRPGPRRARDRTGPKPRAASSCAAPRRSRTSGPPRE